MVEQVGGVGEMGGNVPPKKLRNAYKIDAAPRGTDSVELSSDVMKVKGVNNVRLDRVMEIRRQIADGTYVTDEKLNRALNRAIDQVGRGESANR